MKKARNNTKRVLRALLCAGLILCMCETPEFANQLRNMLLGLVLIAGGSLMAYIGGAGHWQEGPYAEL